MILLRRTLKQLKLEHDVEDDYGQVGKERGGYGEMLVNGSKFRSHKARSCGHLVYHIILVVNSVLLTTNVVRAGEVAQPVKGLAVRAQCPGFDLLRP